MAGIAKAQLPYEIRLHILKFYLASWSTRILNDHSTPETNCARLEHHRGVTNIVPIIPLNPQHSFRGGDRQARVELASIFEVYQHSKFYQRPLEVFFFKHVTWDFTSCSQLKNFPIDTFAKIKKVRLHLECLTGVEPHGFFELVREMYQLITVSPSPCRNLEILELFIAAAHQKGFGQKDDKKLVKKRVHWLALLSRQMVKKSPGLIIRIRGSEHKIHMFEFEQDELFADEFTMTNAKDFLQGTSTLLDGLKSLEFAHLTTSLNPCPPFRLLGDDVPIHCQDLQLYWQMLFAREWKLLEEQGSDLQEGEEGLKVINHELRTLRLEALSSGQ